jgi:hypothetical protein
MVAVLCLAILIASFLCAPSAPLSGDDGSACAILLPFPPCSRIPRPALPRHPWEPRVSALRLSGGSGIGEPRYAWDQTPEEVQLYIFHDGIGGLWREDQGTCVLTVSNSSVAFRFREEGGAQWLLDLPLCFAVDATASHYKVRKDRISVKLRKATPGAIWPALRQVDRMTLEDVPPLPESFRAPPEPGPATTVDAKQTDHSEAVLGTNGCAREAKEAGVGPELTAISDSDKLQVMATERRALEKLLVAAKTGELEELQQMVGTLAQANSVDAQRILDGHRDGNERGVIHLAASTGQLEVLQWALRAGADFGLRDAHGQTAFFIAAANGHLRCVQMLGTETEVDVDAHDSSTEATALHHAAGNGDEDMLMQLLQMGADINANSQLGPAIQWASMSEHSNTVSFLVSNGADPNVRALPTPQVDRNLPPPLVMSGEGLEFRVSGLGCKV